MHVKGHFFPSHRVTIKCVLPLLATHIEVINDEHVIARHVISSLTLSSGMAGLADELNFEDGSRFIPQDVSYRWPFKENNHHIMELP
ncbi:hypothetical protein P4S63_03730 [Pseudoalteromonas sp. B193]